jgi:hypothetical protein
MNKKFFVTVAVFGCATSVYCAGMSSLTTAPEYFDNNVAPAPRIAAAGDAVEIFVGDPQSEAEVFVNGVKVAAEDGARAVSLAGAPDDGYVTYRIDLKTRNETATRFITLFPSPAFVCAVHDLAQKNSFLDSRPAGTVRRVSCNGPVPVAWSSLWSTNATSSLVTVYAGGDTNGTCVGTLVASPAGMEGMLTLKPTAAGLQRGLYTLVHSDGGETLLAYLNVVGDSLKLVFR